MRPPEVHQFLPSLGFRDAIGIHTLGTQRALTRAGDRGRIWVEEAHSELGSHASLFSAFERSRSARRGTSVLVYQASTGTRGMADALAARPERLTLYYHNITPPELFEPYDPGGALTLRRGRQELRTLASRVRVAMANSEYSASDLRELGIPDVRVVPPYLPEGVDASPDPATLERLRGSKRGIDVLFVGRVVPSKGHLHLVRVFAALRAAVDPGARLHVVGIWGEQPYLRTIFRLRDRLGAEGVAFTGSVDEATLAAYYATADVYLSMSEHEGFGVPLVEAMRRGIPVVAYDAAAVSETLGGGGVLVRTTDPPTVAELVGRVASDETLRKQLIEEQHRRVSALEAIPRDDAIVSSIRDVTGS